MPNYEIFEKKKGQVASSAKSTLWPKTLFFFFFLHHYYIKNMTIIQTDFFKEIFSNQKLKMSIYDYNTFP